MEEAEMSKSNLLRLGVALSSATVFALPRTALAQKKISY
jgi:hypothetical protein